MADSLKQQCDAVLDLLTSAKEMGDSWQKFKPEYISHRNSHWNLFETEVSGEATRIFQYYHDALTTDTLRMTKGIADFGIKLKNNLQSSLIVRRIYFGLYFTLINSNSYQQDISRNLLGDGQNFDTEFKHHSIDVYSILRKDWWDDEEMSLDSAKIPEAWEKFEQRMKNLRNALFMELTELPRKGILPEEKSWLARNGIDYSFLL
jgi:hypothetical protein